MNTTLIYEIGPIEMLAEDELVEKFRAFGEYCEVELVKESMIHHKLILKFKDEITDQDIFLAGVLLGQTVAYRLSNHELL